LWLKDELTRNVESWLSPTYPNGKKKHTRRLSDVIEQQKYKDYILTEIKGIEGQIQESVNHADSLGSKKTASNKQELSQFDQVLARIDKRISSHVSSNALYDLEHKRDTELYAPIPELWQQITDEEKNEVIERYVGCIGEYVEKGNEIAKNWYDEKSQSIALQPDRAANIWEEFRDYYVDQIKNSYHPVRSWYINHWDVKEGQLKDADSLEREIFLFCYDRSLPFKNGLYLLANLYACYFAVSRFNAELNINPAPAASAPPPINKSNSDNSTSKDSGVYAVAAMCYYLEKAKVNMFQSKAKFIEDELIPRYKYSFASINNKCSNMSKPDNRRKQRGAIERAIKLMETTEEFNYNAAIHLAKADISIIDNK
ncbi:hypothetical protein LC612_40995, partial [Nostoc sp. CHAB 5834]|nr:hypothetical protein [Nostoc sp. CHAB 5834]